MKTENLSEDGLWLSDFIFITSIDNVTGKQKAKMSYKNFFEDVVTHYQVKIEGWPEHIPFGDLSEVVTNIHNIKTVQQTWLTGKTKFHVLKEGEYQILFEENENMIVEGQKDRSSKQIQSDKGKNHSFPQPNNEAGPSKRPQTMQTDREGSIM